MNTRRGFLGTVAGLLGVGAAAKAAGPSECRLKLGTVKPGWKRNAFTVKPNGPYTGSVTITPSFGGPITLNWTNVDPCRPVTFTLKETIPQDMP